MEAACKHIRGGRHGCAMREKGRCLCMQVPRACFEGETIVLHGPNATSDKHALLRLLDGARLRWLRNFPLDAAPCCEQSERVAARPRRSGRWGGGGLRRGSY